MGTIELNALVNFVGSPLFYSLAFLVAAFGLKAAIVDQSSKGWLLVIVAALMGAFPAIFKTTRTFGYNVISPLNPSGNAADFTHGRGGGATPAATPAGGGTITSGDDLRVQNTPAFTPAASSTATDDGVRGGN